MVYAQRFAASLAGAVRGQSLRQVAREADISHSTLLAVMAGARWPDMITVAKLEESLDLDLWPRRKR